MESARLRLSQEKINRRSLNLGTVGKIPCSSTVPVIVAPAGTLLSRNGPSLPPRWGHFFADHLGSECGFIPTNRHPCPSVPRSGPGSCVFRFFNANDEPVAAPQFDRMAILQLLRPHYGVFIRGTDESSGTDEVAGVVNCVRSILYHRGILLDVRICGLYGA